MQKVSLKWYSKFEQNKNENISLKNYPCFENAD